MMLDTYSLKQDAYQLFFTNGRDFILDGKEEALTN
jgi:hypothetical protein